MKSIFATLAVALCAGIPVGCDKPVCPPLSTAVSLEEVVADYNENAGRVPRLWTHAKVAFTFRSAPGDLGLTWGSTSPLAEVNARLLLRKSGDGTGPQDFFLLVKEAGQSIGRIGISTADGVYYMWLTAGDEPVCYWGRLALAGAPGIAAMPIDPVQLLSVLSICELPADQTAPPLVMQRVTTNPCAYVLSYIDRQPVTGKLLSRRDVYFQRLADRGDNGELVPRPRRPFMVRIFDDQGRCVLTARMNDYRAIPFGQGTLPEEAPLAKHPAIMPTDIHLQWHTTGSEMHILLPKVTMEDRVDPIAFEFWETLPAGLAGRARQVDAALDKPPAKREGRE